MFLLLFCGFFFHQTNPPKPEDSFGGRYKSLGGWIDICQDQWFGCPLAARLEYQPTGLQGGSWNVANINVCDMFRVYNYIYILYIVATYVYWINRLHNLRAHIFSYCASHIFVHNVSNWLENTKLHRHIHIRLWWPSQKLRARTSRWWYPMPESLFRSIFRGELLVSGRAIGKSSESLSWCSFASGFICTIP